MIPVYKCKKCRWIGKDTIFVDGDTECCPRCHDVNFMELVSLEKKSTFTSDDLKVLWQLFQEACCGSLHPESYSICTA